jgi:hypothetical protein
MEGWHTESEKLVNCTHFDRDTGSALGRSHNKPAAATASKPVAIPA